MHENNVTILYISRHMGIHIICIYNVFYMQT